MPTTNSRKHLIPAGTDASFNRETIFEAFGNSIRDVVPVANTTDRGQVVTDLTADSQGPSSTKPLVVHRADAPGLHRLEYTVDGTVWVPGSGVLRFTNTAARDSWTTSNGGYLSAGDRCVAGSVEFQWNGSVWSAGSLGAPHFRLTRNTAAFTLTNTQTNLAWDTTLLDGTLAGFTTDNTVFTCTIPGVYLLSPQVTVDVTATTSIQLRVLKNGTAVLFSLKQSSTVAFESIMLTGTVRFAVGDTFAVALQSGVNVAGVPGSATYCSVDFLHS